MKNSPERPLERSGWGSKGCLFETHRWRIHCVLSSSRNLDTLFAAYEGCSNMNASGFITFVTYISGLDKDLDQRAFHPLLFNLMSILLPT